MLRDLHIKNLAVLEAASIEFGPGFNVLSGETGAGKSIVVDSLALLSGARASSDLIRTGAESLTVTGVFEVQDERCAQLLQSAGLDPGADSLVVRREISHSGRNRIFVDDQPVTLKLLSRLAPMLIRIHGQREELGLVDPELQRTWLDQCGGSEAPESLAATAAAYAEYRRQAERLERSTGDDQARAQRLDMLRYQVTEIDSAAITAGEEDELRREREVLRHAESIQQAISQASTALFEQDGSAYSNVSQALQSIDEIALWEPEAKGWTEELRELEIRLSELEPALRRRLDQVESDPGRLNEVEDRLATLERLLRKYGASSGEILEQRQRMAAELEELEDAESGQEELEEAVSQALQKFRLAASALSSARQRWARDLEARVMAHLQDLALEKSRFTVNLETRKRTGSPYLVAGEAVEFSAHGHDSVVYRFSPNPGEEQQSLAKAASGGELSRLYLAVQLSARQHGDGAAALTLVFDEVDAGISGAEAAVLGAKLQRLADGGQVLAVTHLPQVASCADRHFQVQKGVRDERTYTEVRRLDDDGRIAEVARMLAGSEITEISLSHARELIAGAHV